MKACGGRFLYRQLDMVTVKGRTNPTRAYCPMTAAEERRIRPELRRWQKAFDMYVAGDFTRAAKEFKALLKRHPDSELYGLYAARAAALIKNRPSSWTGVWTMKTK